MSLGPDEGSAANEGSAPSVATVSGDVCEVRITGPDLDWLVEHTRRLIEDRLVACGQHETTVRSLYRWQGVVEDDTEARVALHTQYQHVAAIIQRTTAEHPDDVPGIIVMPITDGNPDYLHWVRQATSPEGGR